jgi:hypothetical protein
MAAFWEKSGVVALRCRSPGERGEVHVVKILELAMAKAANLSEAAQEELGLELLERIDELAQLRAEIEIGLRDLEAGRVEELDIEELVQELRDEYAREQK